MKGVKNMRKKFTRRVSDVQYSLDLVLDGMDRESIKQDLEAMKGLIEEQLVLKRKIKLRFEVNY